MLCFSLNGFGSFEFGDYSMSNTIDLFSIVTNLWYACVFPETREHQRLCNLFPLHPPPKMYALEYFVYRLQLYWIHSDSMDLNQIKSNHIL